MARRSHTVKESADTLILAWSAVLQEINELPISEQEEIIHLLQHLLREYLIAIKKEQSHAQ